MIRTTTSIIILAAMAAVSQGAGTRDLTVDSLGARLTSIESRLLTVETSLGGSREQAMMSATKANTTYVIKDGDTLGSIASKNDVPRASLLDANKLREGQPIYIGETLIIPKSPKSTSADVASNNSKKGTSKIAPPPTPKKETVKKTVSKKSKPVAETKPAPVKKKAPAPKVVTHTVRSGDTLHRIARKYKTSVAALKSNNGLRSDVISPGQRLKVSGAKNEPVKEQASAPKKSTPSTKKGNNYENPMLKENESYGYYSVAKGDNLFALARDFFTSMPELQRLNKLGKSTIIYPGDELIVPTSKYNSYHKNVAKK